MKLAIVSDSHDNLPNVEKFLAYAGEEKIDALIHCGDITNTETLEKFAEGFTGPIHFVFGNVVASREEIATVAGRFSHLHLYGDEGQIEWAGKKIGFCHKPEEAQALNRKDKFDFIFNGHTHLPWVEKVGGTLLVNPGTLGGVFTEATFAVYDRAKEKLDLKTLNRL